MSKRHALNFAIKLQITIHFFGQRFCSGGGSVGIVLAIGGVDDAARRIYDDAAVGGHTIAANCLQASTLCTHAGYKQETAGGATADVGKHFAACGSHHIHHFIGRCPGLRLLNHFLKESAAVAVGCELEIH